MLLATTSKVGQAGLTLFAKEKHDQFNLSICTDSDTMEICWVAADIVRLLGAPNNLDLVQSRHLGNNDGLVRRVIPKRVGTRSAGAIQSNSFPRNIRNIDTHHLMQDMSVR